MRRSLRFFSSCSSSSVIVRSLIQQKVFARHTAQDHPFQTVQIVKTITAGLTHGPQQRFPWILSHQAQQLGLGHFEGRNWRGFHHHATLCIAAYGFLVAERNRAR